MIEEKIFSDDEAMELLETISVRAEEEVAKGNYDKYIQLMDLAFQFFGDDAMTIFYGYRQSREDERASQPVDRMTRYTQEMNRKKALALDLGERSDSRGENNHYGMHLLEKQLEVCVAIEDYEGAAILRDSINLLKKG